MPSKFVIRQFAENQHYHVFNRGVERRNIFLDKQDYKMFKYYLFIYLSPPKKVSEKYPALPLRLQARNLNEELELAAYCMMPNHFHLLLRQKSQDAISKFMKQLSDGYTRYFNEKYERVGGLMQGRYKAALINSDDILMHIARYIHLNPLVSNKVKGLRDYAWSSHLNYLGIVKENFLHSEDILSRFRSVSGYEKFVNDHSSYAKELDKIKHLVID